MNHDILKRLGLDHLDASSPDFLQTLQRLQREAWESLRRDDQSRAELQHAEEFHPD
jgi:hypothetical protein